MEIQRVTSLSLAWSDYPIAAPFPCSNTRSYRWKVDSSALTARSLLGGSSAKTAFPFRPKKRWDPHDSC
jgi:hypothetical protein